MTPIIRWTRYALLGLPIMTASCAALPPSSVRPPRLTLPQTATTPCILPRLPAVPTEADLEVVYGERGARLVACETARALAVEILLAERALQDRWHQENEAPPQRKGWPW